MTTLLQEPDLPTSVEYRLGKKAGLWVAFTPIRSGGGDAWQMQMTARGRGGAKTLAVLLETTALCPLASVTVRGESYPLTIGWHILRRGGVLCLGGERRTGLDGSMVSWEMRWMPSPDLPGGFLVEMRVRATPRREGHLHLLLNTPLHSPDIWELPCAAGRGHGAALAWSAYNRHWLGAVTLEGAGLVWDAAQNAWTAAWRSFPLGGGRLLRFGLHVGTSPSAEEARGALAAQYAALAVSRLHPVSDTPVLNAAPVIAALIRPEAFAIQGAERLYLQPPVPEADTFYAGFPHYPADALQAVWNWNRFWPNDHQARLVRFGARGLAADFQVMGRQGESEPNKGAFWDKRTGGTGTDFAGGATHGVASNARLARAFFLLHDALREPLLRQAALNICQWLILKQNERGYFDGARVHATRGLSDDGRFLPDDGALDGAEAIRPLVLAFRTTGNEVFVKAAWKIANFLLDQRPPTFDLAPSPGVASVILGLLALDAEAPNARLRAALAQWKTWLHVLPLPADAPEQNADGLGAGLYECAEAGFLLHALTASPVDLRYAFSALGAVPAAARACSWRQAAARTTALLSLTCLLPDARPDFDALQVSLGWRQFAPDPAAAQFLRVTGTDGAPVEFLPLVCRLNDQLLLIALAPPSTPSLTVCKNGRRPLVRDLLTDTVDSEAPLHPLLGEDWARVGLFTIDP